MAEFVANKDNSSFTKLSPFFISKRLYSYISFDTINLLDTIIYEWINKKKTINISEFVQLICKPA